LGEIGGHLVWLTVCVQRSSDEPPPGGVLVMSGELLVGVGSEVEIEVGHVGLFCGSGAEAEFNGASETFGDERVGADLAVFVFLSNQARDRVDCSCEDRTFGCSDGFWWERGDAGGEGIDELVDLIGGHGPGDPSVTLS
jgi:hypothetical protein